MATASSNRHLSWENGTFPWWEKLPFPRLNATVNSNICHNLVLLLIKTRELIRTHPYVALYHSTLHLTPANKIVTAQTNKKTKIKKKEIETFPLRLSLPSPFQLSPSAVLPFSNSSTSHTYPPPPTHFFSGDSYVNNYLSSFQFWYGISVVVFISVNFVTSIILSLVLFCRLPQQLALSSSPLSFTVSPLSSMIFMVFSVHGFTVAVSFKFKRWW